MTRIQFLLIVVWLIFATTARAQDDQAAGGKLPGATPSTKAPVKTARSPAKPAKKTPSSEVAKTSANATVDRIDGKWWTTGNGFGDSEVVFTQNGSDVSGTIVYADGRTGSLKGRLTGKRLQHTWTNSSGDGGTGWLELSWNNFLGGPWHNQKTRDGSWTLSRIEGKWCFGGSRNRIRTVTHDAQGRLLMITEEGSRDGGYLEGPWLYLESDFGNIKGGMNFRANRVEWSSGFYWTWCGR